MIHLKDVSKYRYKYFNHEYRYFSLWRNGSPPPKFQEREPYLFKFMYWVLQLMLNTFIYVIVHNTISFQIKLNKKSLLFSIRVQYRGMWRDEASLLKIRMLIDQTWRTSTGANDNKWRKSTRWKLRSRWNEIFDRG